MGDNGCSHKKNGNLLRKTKKYKPPKPKQMKPEMSLLITLVAILLGIWTILIAIDQQRMLHTKMLMIALVNTIFEDINNALLRELAYELPIERISSDGGGSKLLIDKSTLFNPENEYCNPCFLKNGYTLIVSHEDGFVRVFVRQRNKKNKTIYSKSRRIYQ
jgi:hypothetical protein